MITWMQRKKKLLVIVMWITVLAFVGAGFVGWGSYQYGSKSSSIAAVGDFQIKRVELQNEYNKLYSYYSQLFDGELPQAQADELQSIAVQRLVNQAYLMNLGKDFGVVVSNDEIANKIVAMDEFKQDGTFSKELYMNTLNNARMTIEEFEESVKKDILLTKLADMFSFTTLDSEKETVAASIFLADNILIKVIDEKDVKLSINEKELKEFWSGNKGKYMGEPTFDISYIEIKKSAFDATEEEAKEYFDKNRAEFMTANTIPGSYKEVKEKAIEAVKYKKAKTQALKEKIAFKKEQAEVVVAKGISLTNDIVPFEEMKKMDEQLSKEISKPIKTESGYIVLKILDRHAPQVLPYEVAKKSAKADLMAQKLQTSLDETAKRELANFTGKKIGYVTRSDLNKIDTLSTEEASLFLNQLFNSNSRTGYVNLDKKVVVYKILEQKLFAKDKIDSNKDFINSNAKKIKKSLIDTEIIKHLQNEYKVQKFYEGV